MAKPASLMAARDFVRRHAVVLGLVVVAMVIGYGFALTSFALSIDEDQALTRWRAETWIEQGRLGIPLMQSVLRDMVAMPFFNMALALVSLYCAGVVWAFIISHAARPGRVGSAGVLLFLIVFTTLPVNAYYLAFDTISAEVSLAWLLAAISVWLSWRWAMESGGWGSLVGAMAAAALAMMTFQDFVFTIGAGIIIVQLAYLLGRRASDAPGAREAIRQTLMLAIPATAAVALTVLAALILLERGGYIESLVGWGAEDPRAILRNIIKRAAEFMTGHAFHGGWVLVPTVAAGILLGVLVAAKGSREERWYPLALWLLIGVMPFAGWIAIGHPLPNRSMQAVVLVAASVWLLLAQLLRSRRELGALLLIMAGLFAIWNGSILTRSYVTEHQTYVADRDVARLIGERLAAAGWDGSEIPIVTVGKRSQGMMERMAQLEFLGFSLFNDIDGRRSPEFMRLLGYQVRRADDPEWDAAQAKAAAMPDWPAAGAVVLEDGVAIVRFSAPCADPRVLYSGQCAPEG